MVQDIAASIEGQLSRMMERAALLQELRCTAERIAQNDSVFDMVTAPELTDYAIHERCALLARYSYLMRRIRECDAQTASDAII